jgi:hypothetical protein
MSYASGGGQRRAGSLPDLRHGFGAAHGDRRRRGEPGAGGYATPVLARPRPGCPRCRAGDVVDDPRAAAAARAPYADRQLDRACVCDAGGAVGGRAVLRTGVGLRTPPQPEHVHADRHGDRCGLRLQLHSHGRPRDLPCIVPRQRRRGRRVLRGRGSHHRVGPLGSGARAASAQPDLQRNTGSARPGPQQRQDPARRRQTFPSIASSAGTS